MSASQIFCGNVHVRSSRDVKPVRNSSSIGSPAIRIVFSNPTAVAELKVKDVMSMCEAKMKQNNDHRIGNNSTPAAKTQNSTRATSSASSGMQSGLRVQFRPTRHEFRQAVAFHVH